MTVVDVLRRARALVARGWTQQCFARTANGWPADPRSSLAQEWCMFGALEAAGADQYFDYSSLKIIGDIDWNDAPGRRQAVADWNDVPGRTQAEVLAAFDAAIEAAS